MKKGFGLAFALLALTACGKRDEPAPVVATQPAVAAGTEAAVAAVAPGDYGQASAWLCRPETADACDQDASATIVAPDGKLTVEAFKADPAAPIDCFYVYPTVSLDETPNSDIVVGEEEKRAALVQVARFGAACRIYAPMYRQTTLVALRALLRGENPATDREMAYADVKAAWARYLANDNAGRGVVLIGHDQGAGLLARLIASEIEAGPAREKLVSAILLGSTVDVTPRGGPGGSFREMPTCQSADEIGCVIAYAAFRADAPPPEQSLFGRASEAGMQAACVNPAVLDGSSGELNAYLQSERAAINPNMADTPAWATGVTEIGTTFVTLPGLLKAECVTAGGRSYLAVTINGDPMDARTDEIVGDVVVAGQMAPAWGLHLVDMNLAMGNLVAVVKRQGAAFLAREAGTGPDAHK